MFRFTKKLNIVKRVLKPWSKSINPTKELELKRKNLANVQSNLKNNPYINVLRLKEIRLTKKKGAHRH